MEATALKFPCPYCNESFNSKFELDMHTWKKHPATTKPASLNTSTVKTLTPPPTQRTPEKPVKGEKLAQQEELLIEYNLAESMESIGQLYPVLVDAYGNVIDGFHRLKINPNAEKMVKPEINTPELLEAARLAANYDRRTIKQDEVRDRILFLAKKGVNAKEIARMTGVSERTVYRNIPKNLKAEVAAKISEAKKAKVSEVARNEVTNVTSPITIQDSTQVASRSPECTPTHTPTEQSPASRLPTPESLPSSTPTKKQLTPEEAAKLAEGYRESAEEDLKIAEEMTGKDYANTPTLNDEETPQPKTTETWVSVTVECYNYKKHAIVQTRSVEVGDDRFCASDCEANACPLNRSKERKLNNSSAAPLTSN